MVKEAKVLEHYTYAPPQRCNRIAGKGRHVMAELGNQPSRRPQGEKQEPEQGGLAGARGAGKELKGMRIDAEREVAKHLRSQPIAQAHILESDHPPLSDNLCLAPPRITARHVVLRISPPRACKASGIALFTRLWRPRQSGGPNWAGDPANRRRAMVSDRLTDGWYGGTRTPMLIVCPNCSNTPS